MQRTRTFSGRDVFSSHHGGACGSQTRRILAFALSAIALLAVAAPGQPYSVFAKRGTLQDPATVGSGSAFKEIELADLNDDGRPDFVLPQKQPLITEDSNRDILYLSSGGDFILAVDTLSSKFTLKPTAQAFGQALDTSRAYDVELEDMDGDGALDMIRPDTYGNLTVWWGATDAGGNPTGVFDQYRDVFDPPGFDVNALCGAPFELYGNYDDVALADVDDDGDMDFVVSDRELECPATSPLPRNFIVENLRFDAGGNQPRVFQIRAADPSIPLGQLDELPARQTHTVAIGDINPPSDLDVVLAELDLTRIYFGGVGGDPYNFEAVPLVLAEPGIVGKEVVVGDLVHLDADTHLDLFVGQNTIGGVTHGAYFHSGNSKDPYPEAGCGGKGLPCAWQPAPPIDYAALGISDPYMGIYDARYGDLDEDGRVEIVLVNQNVDNMSGVFQTALQVLTVTASKTFDDRTTTFMEAPSTLTGGMAIDLGDLDNDGDDDMVLGGAIKPAGTIIAAATVYENRTKTVLAQRNPLDTVHGQTCNSLTPCTIVAIEELRAGDDVVVPSGANVTLESGGSILLTDGFHAVAGSEFAARTF